MPDITLENGAIVKGFPENPTQKDLEKLDRIRKKYSIQSQPQQPTTPEVSQLESAIRGGAQGLTLGLSDEATAFLEKMIGKDYQKSLEETRQKYKQAQEANPITYTGGEITGAVLPALATGGAGATPTLGRLVATGAGLGAIQGAGLSEAKPLEQPKEFIQDIASGASIGGAFPVLGRSISKGMSYIKPSIDVLTKKTLTGLTGKTEKFLEEIDKNPQAVKRIQEKFGGDIQQEILPEINAKINDFMVKNPYKQRAIQGSQKAINAIPEDVIIEKKTGEKVIIQALKKLEDDPYTQTAKDARNILNDYLNNFEQAPEIIEGKKLKTILQNLDSDIEDKFGGYGNPFKNDVASNTIKELRFAWDNELKTKVPEYEKIMRKVRRDTQASASLTERFATKEGIQPSKIQTFTDRLVREQNRALTRPDIQKDVRRIEAISRLPEEQLGLETLKQDVKDIGLKKAIEARGNQGSNLQNPILYGIGGALGGIGGSIGGPTGTIIGGGLGAGLSAIVGRQLEQKGGKIAESVLRATQGMRSQVPTQISPAIQRGINVGSRAVTSPILNDFLKMQASERDRKKAMEERTNPK